jgi:CHAP domain
LQHSLYGSRNRELTDTADNYLNIREIEPNRSPDIDRWNNDVGAPLGSPYCASYTSAMLEKAHTYSPKTRTALARNFWNKANRNDRHTAREILNGQYSVQEGDIVVWARGNTIRGHVGIAYRNWYGKAGRTIEANTSSGVRGSQFDGDGVHLRRRAIEPYNYFKIMGVIETEEHPIFSDGRDPRIILGATRRESGIIFNDGRDLECLLPLQARQYKWK